MSNNIVESIGLPATLEQMAEECCELAMACMKMARKLRDENPTPKSIEDIRDNLVEEMADVSLCFDVILHETNLVNVREMTDIMFEKDERWRKRLNLHLDLD